MRGHRALAVCAALCGAATCAGPASAAGEWDPPLIVTASNWGYRSVMMNFVCRLRMLGMLPKYDLVVLTFDEMTATMIEKEYRKIGVRHMPSPWLTNKSEAVFAAEANKHGAGQARASSFGAKDWNSVTARKLSGVLALLKQGHNILFIDVDIAVARGELVDHVMNTYVTSSAPDKEGPDFVFQLNVRDPPPCASKEDPAARAAARLNDQTFRNINSGFYFLRSNPRGIELLKRAVGICAREGKDDQEGFLTALQDVTREKQMHFHRDCDPYKIGTSAALRVCTWHECDMPTGWATGRFPARNEDPAVVGGFTWMQNASTGPYLYHPNYIAGMGNKINKLKVKGLWVAEESRCNPASSDF